MSPDLSLTKIGAGRGNPKVLCSVTLSIVFLCGALAGALFVNLGMHRSLHKASFFTDSGKAAYLAKIKKDLNLTPAQTEQMESILDDFSTYYRNVLADGKSRIMQILNEEQRRKFEQMLAEQKVPR